MQTHRHKVDVVKSIPFDDVALVKGTIEKCGNDIYITSPNLVDNLIINSGLPFRVE